MWRTELRVRSRDWQRLRLGVEGEGNDELSPAGQEARGLAQREGGWACAHGTSAMESAGRPRKQVGYC